LRERDLTPLDLSEPNDPPALWEKQQEAANSHLDSSNPISIPKPVKQPTFEYRQLSFLYKISIADALASRRKAL
jgi:hypothetical protein